MSVIDKTFQIACGAILSHGTEYENKNRGVKRLQVPSMHLVHEFADGFPAISLKKLYWRGVVAELLWFLNFDNDIKYLNENGCKIWNQDAYNWYVKKYSNNDPIEGQEEFYHKNEDGSYRMFTFEEFDERGVGSVGRNYSKQWGDFNGEVNQIKTLIDGMSKDIFSSRLLVTAWNPSELGKTALPPCHQSFQVIGSKTPSGAVGFYLSFAMRSWDFLLGASYNLASYALLAKILERVTGYEALGVIAQASCVHFYDNQYMAAKELVNRDADKHPNCEVELPDVKREEGMSDYEYFEHYLQNVTPKDFKLVGYTSDEAIKVDMLAPKQI